MVCGNDTISQLPEKGVFRNFPVANPYILLEVSRRLAIESTLPFVNGIMADKTMLSLERAELSRSGKQKGRAVVPFVLV